MGKLVEICIILAATIGQSCAVDSCESSGLQPMVFPNQLPQASAAISNLLSDAFGLSDYDLFLSYDYWPVPLNNSSILTT